MYKKIAILLLAVMLSIGFGSAYALESTHVVDKMDYLKQDQINELQSTIDQMRDTYQMDAVIVITDNTEGKTAEAYADDYFDYNGYGVGADHSGLLLLVDMDKRKMHISTTGHAIDVFTDARIENMVNAVTAPLKEEDYFGASQAFLEQIDYYAQEGVPRGQYRTSGDGPYKASYGERVGRMLSNPLSYVIPLLIAIGATIVITLSSKGKVTVTNRTYEDQGSFDLTKERDDYLRESTTRTKIEKSSNSGSSTHSGSSGRSHGGGGGSF